MPDKEAVRQWWAPWLVEKEKFDSVGEVMEADYCFACGTGDVPTERAHIRARVEGGSDSKTNIHLLCHECHIESEMIKGYKYYKWFVRQNVFGMALNSYMRRKLKSDSN